MNEDEKIIKKILIVSIILFVLSLTQECYCTTSNCSDSIMVFLLGWAAIFSTGAGLCWFANPLLFISWIFLKKKLKLSMFLSITSFLLSFLFLIFDSIVDNENGGSHQIISYKSGYWLWLASGAVMVIGTFILMYRFNVRIKQLQESDIFKWNVLNLN
ncbi:MAG: hypothetical protein IPP34_14715 [Bacteroidetes bacterium]|nr:hypothetical protein [Bacteroidota bacterium]